MGCAWPRPTTVRGGLKNCSDTIPVNKIVAGRLGCLQCGGQTNDIRFTARPAGDLEPDRHSVASETRAKSSRGKAQKIERVCVIDPGDQSSMCEAGRLVQTTVKGGHRYDGRKDRAKIVKL